MVSSEAGSHRSWTRARMSMPVSSMVGTGPRNSPVLNSDGGNASDTKGISAVDEVNGMSTQPLTTASPEG